MAEETRVCKSCGETNGHKLDCPTLPACGCRDDHVSWCPHFKQPTRPSCGSQHPGWKRAVQHSPGRPFASKWCDDGFHDPAPEGEGEAS